MDSVKDTFLILLLTSALQIVAPSFVCSVDSSSASPKYHLLEKCYRSKLGIAAKANYKSLSSCLKFATEKKGLALNFSPPEAWEEFNGTLEYTCEVLKCAEADGGLSLMNDTKFDYYSLYGKPLPHVNSTCVPATGMFFLITKRLNYTLGARECKNISAVPADVTNEQRTDALAQLLTGAGVDAAFVGLRSKNGSAFISSNGDTLDCTTYRAWAPGHPGRYRSKFDCVLITRHRTWQTTSCNKTHPMLCELTPNGPYKKGSIFISRRQNKNGAIYEDMVFTNNSNSRMHENGLYDVAETHATTQEVYDREGQDFCEVKGQNVSANRHLVTKKTVVENDDE